MQKSVLKRKLKNDLLKKKTLVNKLLPVILKVNKIHYQEMKT